MANIHFSPTLIHQDPLLLMAFLSFGRFSSLHEEAHFGQNIQFLLDSEFCGTVSIGFVSFLLL